MADRASVAFRNLHNWKTLYVGKTWYVLSQVAKDNLEDLIVRFDDNVLSPKESLDLEVATGRNGLGTNKIRRVNAEAAVLTLRSER